MLRTLLLSFLVAAVHLCYYSSAHAIATPPTAVLVGRDDDNRTDIVPFPFDESNEPLLENIFSAIEKIPDSVLDAGGNATGDWFANQGLPIPTPGVSRRQSWIAIAQCAFEIAKAI